MKHQAILSLIAATALVANAQAPLPGISEEEVGIATKAASAAICPTTQNLPEKALTGETPTAKNEPAYASTRSKTKAVSSVADLAGGYVMTYETLISSGSDGGKSVTVKQITGTDSISITNFWSAGLVVKAYVDLSSMTISIPNQVLGTHSTYGEYDIALCTSTGSADRTTEISGTISTDGTITITSWWGVYITDTSYYGSYFGLYYNTAIEPANTTMSYQTYDYDSDTYTTTSFNVIVAQEGSNLVTVKNFGNYGKTIDIILQSDSTATIDKQVGYEDATYGDRYVYAAEYSSTYSSVTSYTSPIYCDKATDSRTISWGAWNIMNSTYFMGYVVSGTITAPFDLTYPTAASTSFSGSGTESDPYLIKSLEDLVLLADNVNNSEDLSYGATLNPFARVYLNEYFRLENDIDMANYRFSPIGQDFSHRFAGTFDGNGKTITGLNVSTGSTGYAALFGRVDTVCVIKNLTLANPTVTTDGYYAAAVVAYSQGTVENCHVTGGDITSTSYRGVGGIASYVMTITGCSVTSSTITGLAGYAGGVAAQVNTAASDCHAIACSIVASGTSSTQPSGGVFAYLYMADADGCHFSGTVDGTSYSGLSLGGIAGTNYRSVVSRCYSVGTILGYGSSTYVGGIIGSLQGTVENCYSVGILDCADSPYVGGICGYSATYYSASISITQAAIASSYTAATINCDTYQYDTLNGCREILGTAASSSSPSITSTYFDKQIVNFNSAQCGVKTSALTSASGPDGFESSTWTFAEGYYPRLAGMDSTEDALYGASAIIFDDNSSINKVAKSAKLNLLGSTTAYFVVDSQQSATGYYSQISGDSIKIGADFGTDTLYFANSTPGSRYYCLKIAPIPFDGDGSEDSPYLISTKSDLISLADITTNKGQYFPDSYLLMTNDIDMELDTAFVGICCVTLDSYCTFEGTFDGGGHTIHNLKLPSAFNWTTAPEDDSEGLGTPDNSTENTTSYYGFMGRLSSNGTLKNLSMAADCDFSLLWAITGPFAGCNYGKIDNCVNYADISTLSCWVGGITGYNAETGEVTNCYNAGNVTSGYRYAGGIAGTNFGLIKNCQNAGDVAVAELSRFMSGSKLIDAGGIAGYASGGRFDNCVNLGSVTCYYRAGGISGTLAAISSSVTSYRNDVINCINYGSVLITAESDYVGEIGGTSGTSGTISDSYYDEQITFHKAHGNEALDGVTPVETSQLTSGTALDNYSTDTWDFSAGLYPALKAFTSDTATLVKRSIIVGIATNETVANLRSNAWLSSDNDCVWTLKVGTAFKISGDSLIVPSSVEAITVDTLVATAGEYSKMIVIRSTPVVPLDGDGTADSPYLINNAADWNSLADYIATYSDKMTGNYVKLTADIDFSDTVMTALAYDRVTEFNGDLDGNGKTITGFSSTADANYYGALIITTGSKAVIHDLTAEGTVTLAKSYSGGLVGNLYGKLVNVTGKTTVTSTKSYSAGMVGYAYTGASLEGCSFEGTVSSSSTYIAGLVGYSQAGVRYEDCVNKGTITHTGTTAKTYTAGLVAYCYPDTFINCWNEGVIAATSSSAGGLGGLVGYAYESSTTGGVYYFKNCYNTSDISSAYNNAGLIMNTASASIILMEGCYNTGNISSTYSSTKSSTYTAGLVTTYSKASTFRDCWNSGTITSTGPIYAGGLFAYYKGTYSEDTRTYITNCYNTGDVVATGNVGAGIAGYVYNYVTIDSCYNTGNISGGYGLGGVVGGLKGANSVISNCYNAGDVTSSSYEAGGIVGYNTTASTITGCFNVGDVSSTSSDSSTGYAIGGIAGQSGAAFSNIYNMGGVTGAAYSGGLVGQPTIATTTIDGGYSTATASTGNILGVATTDGTYWGEGNTLTGTYYLAANAVECTDTASAGLTYAELAKLDLGSSWTAGDNYTYPRLAALADNDYAKAYAAAVIPSVDTDTYAAMTGVFYLGAPDDVAWAADNSVISFDGQTGYFNADYSGGTITMTATCGDATATTQLTYGVVTGVDDIGLEAAEIVSETLYNTSGQIVTAPADGQKAIYIVRRVYSDGTVTTAKEAR